MRVVPSLFIFGVCLSAAAAQLPSPLFVPDFALPLDAAPRVVGDFDNDGDNDLLGPTGPLINDGSGRFVYGPSSTLFTDLKVGAAGDFDGDGFLDIVHVKSTTGGTMYFARNLGGGVFASMTTAVPTSTAVPNEILAADLDLDGRADLLINNDAAYLFSPGTPTYWRCLTNFAFTDFSATLPPLVAGLSPGRLFAVRDLDGDSDPDVVVLVAGVRVLFNDGVGGFTVGPLLSLPGVSPAVLGDFDGDGDVDLACGAPPLFAFNFARSVVALNQGGGVFTAFTVGTSPTMSLPRWLAAVDVDGDGAAELVAQLANVVVVADVTSSGAVAYPPFQSLPSQSPPAPNTQLAMDGLSADFDADGDADILAFGSDGSLQILRSSGVGALVTDRKRLSDGVVGNKGTLLFDADGDGLADLHGEGFKVARNDGYGGHQTVLVPSNFHLTNENLEGPCAIADFDGDGDLDVAMTGVPGVLPRLDIVANDGSPNFHVVSVPTNATGLSSVVAADFDADGRVDLAYTTDNFSYPGDSGVKLQRNVGPGAVFAGHVNFAAARRAHDLVVADLDGDGSPDLVVASEGFAPGAIVPCTIMLNQGGFAFQELAPFGYVAASTVAAGDVDGDGDIDVVLDGTIWFRTPTSFLQGTTYAGPAIAGAKHRLLDLDEDGDLDLLWGDRWLRNSGTGAFVSETLPGAGAFVGVGCNPFPNPLLQIADFDRDGDLDLVDARGRLYFNRRRQLELGLPARLGRTTSIEGFGPAGAPFDIAVSLQRASTPILFPPFGAILLDVDSIMLIAQGSLDASGRRTLAFTVPAVPTLVGLSLAWQGLLPLEGRLTGLVEPPIVGY